MVQHQKNCDTVSSLRFFRDVHNELNFLEMDGRFEESVGESEGRSDRNLWISLGEISEKDFKGIRNIAKKLAALPFELSDKA